MFLKFNNRVTVNHVYLGTGGRARGGRYEGWEGGKKAWISKSLGHLHVISNTIKFFQQPAVQSHRKIWWVPSQTTPPVRGNGRIRVKGQQRPQLLPSRLSRVSQANGRSLGFVLIQQEANGSFQPLLGTCFSKTAARTSATDRTVGQKGWYEWENSC